MAQNHPEKIAIVGATGRIGGYFARALLKAGKHTITTLRRADSKGKYPEGAKIVDVDFDDENSLVKALEGQQVLIITLSVRAPPTLHSTIVKAAVKAGVPYIMPNTWGLYLTDELAKNSQYAANGLKLYQEIQDLGATYIAMGCGFWYEWSLGLGEPWYGFDIKARTVTFYDDGKTVINTSTWDQCARAIVALLSLPVRGASPALSDWDNRAVLVSSFRVSQRDMLDSLHRVLGTTDADWEISYEQTDLREKRGLKMAAAGDLTGIATSLYARAFMPSSQSDFKSRHGTDNEKLGLPKEDLDEATKRTVDMVNAGFSPMTQFS